MDEQKINGPLILLLTVIIVERKVAPEQDGGLRSESVRTRIRSL